MTTSSRKYTIYKKLRPHFRRLDKITSLGCDSPYDDTKFTNKAAYVCWVGIILYNIQLAVMAFLNRHSTEEVVNASFLLSTTLTALVKQIAFVVKVKRWRHLLDMPNGELFAPKNQAHLDLLDENEKSMGRMYTFYAIMTFTGCISHYQYPMIARMMSLGENQIPVYFPFDTTRSPIYELASIYLTLVLTFQGYVYMLVDWIAVTFYAQCKVQLSMLRYDLEHLVDDDSGGQEERRGPNGYHYKDNDEIQSRFIHCVKHYELIKWYVTETQSITAEYMALQITSAIWTICMTTYRIVGVKGSIFTAEVAPNIVYLGCMLMQLFFYCYYGNQVLYESELLCPAAYCADWVSLSPGFRRQLVLFMSCCSRPVAIYVAIIVPVQLNTYIAVLKASYTLFTFLNTKNSQ